MKITERRLRQIIRSVIKENANDPYLDPTYLDQNSHKLKPEDVFFDPMDPPVSPEEQLQELNKQLQELEKYPEENRVEIVKLIQKIQRIKDIITADDWGNNFPDS